MFKTASTVSTIEKNKKLWKKIEMKKEKNVD